MDNNKLTIYLVGGAVRDELLGIDNFDRDWVVVGSSIQEMLSLGYKQVGKSFPVFLHPHTKEEYALARTERKSGRGYSGFICDFAPTVTIEEDLIRRDLTINAIAKNQAGIIIDPFHGIDDLHNKVLRHVSPAFTEDPLRILRIARFNARLHHLGFTITQSTMELLKEMVHNNELLDLTVERVWQEIHLALQTKSPWIFFEVLHQCNALQTIFPPLNKLYGIPQPKKYHPEIDSFVHTMDVLKKASLISNKPEVRFAALCHDLGKSTTPTHMLPRHIGHEERGVPLIRTWCQQYKVPNAYLELSTLVARWHTLFRRVKELRPKTLLRFIHNLDAIRKHDRFHDFVLACSADIYKLNTEGHSCLAQDFLYNAVQIVKNVKLDLPSHMTNEEIKLKVWTLQLQALTQWLQKEKPST